MGLPPAARIKCRPAVKTWLGTACYLELGQLLHVFASLLTYIDSGRFVLILAGSLCEWSECHTIHWSHTLRNFLCTSSLVNWSLYTCASSWLLYMESCHTRRWLPCSAGESRSRPVVSFPWFDKQVWCDPSTSGVMYHYVTLLCYLPVDSCIMRPYTSYTRKFCF